MLCDLELEDLRRAFVNPIDAGIAEEAFGIIFCQIARTAINLHHAINDAPTHFRCKNLGGSGLAQDIFSGIGATRMACPEGMEQAAAFARALHATTAHRVAGDLLELIDASGRVVARLQAELPR